MRHTARLFRSALAAVCFVGLQVGVVYAQDWASRTSDDGIYAAGVVSFGQSGVGFVCAARSVQNKPVLDTRRSLSNVARPWYFTAFFSDQLIRPSQSQRRDIEYLVDGYRYRLPVVRYSKPDRAWHAQVAMDDPLFEALERASFVSLRIGVLRKFTLSVSGLGPALQDARRFCAKTWTATGFPAPLGSGLEKISTPFNDRYNQLIAPVPVRLTGGGDDATLIIEGP
ncbi:hypothetical protein [Sulfitobacter aestuariivivens]|uniref:Uncharacterized protein n=1 Tax=Sulfitobacter aestuariivivens TaxID=2766981 RepID=A0A927D6R6_9RHOB|nr:hypothetical protein [Sulfitobacter aestuariivivens]MBD3664242.1 hypothetical protein [Sulfitobacter aestuariivivens]